jgi:hypothetical protein
MVAGSNWDGSIVRMFYQAYGRYVNPRIEKSFCRIDLICRESGNVEDMLAKYRSILANGILDVNLSLKV